MRLLSLILCCSSSFTCGTGFLCSQPPQQQPGAVLRSDPRLKVLVTLKFDSMPASAEVLGALQKKRPEYLSRGQVKPRVAKPHSETRPCPICRPGK